MSDKNEATFFKEDVEKLLARYGKLSVYETIGALEVVKANLLERLNNVNRRHVLPVGDLREHGAGELCDCNPIEIEPGLWVHHAFDGREKYERGAEQSPLPGWHVVLEK